MGMDPVSYTHLDVYKRQRYFYWFKGTDNSIKAANTGAPGNTIINAVDLSLIHIYKVTISYTGTVGISQNAEEQEWLDGPGYAYWYNKARLLQGCLLYTSRCV